MKDTAYKIIMYWARPTGYLSSKVPELAGCMARGVTRAAAVRKAEAAIDSWIQIAREDALSIPEPRGKPMPA